MNEQRSVAEAVAPYQWSRNDPAWIPGADEALIADYDRLKADLDVERQAHDDGYSNLPVASDVEMNEAQLRIRNVAVQKIGQLYAFLSNELGMAAGHMIGDAERLDLRNQELEAETAFRRALLGDAQLKRASETLAAAEQALKHFTARNRLLRPPHYAESLWLAGSVLVALTLVESFLNGFIFKDVNEGGWSGGVLLAMGISLINVTLGLIAGAVGWRLIGHRFILPRVVGWTVTLCISATAAIWNVFVAHYRELAEQLIKTMSSSQIPFDASGSWAGAAEDLFANAWRHMLGTGWFNFESIWCWLLLAVGIVVFLLACLKGWSDLDRYWDYRKFDIARRYAEIDLENECSQVLGATFAHLDACLQACRHTWREIERQAARSEAVADLAEQRSAEVADLAALWIGDTNRLLKFYREENEKVRASDVGVPPYWASYPTPEQYRNLLVENAEGGAKNLNLASKHLEAIRDKRQTAAQIVAANKTAFAQFERFVIDLKKSAPERVKELRNAATERAKGVVADRIHHELEIETAV
jgi:hypothetical protein